MGAEMTGWHGNSGEQTMIWSTTTRDMGRLLRDLADELDAREELLLICLYVTSVEMADPSALRVQATITTVPEEPS